MHAFSDRDSPKLSGKSQNGILRFLPLCYGRCRMENKAAIHGRNRQTMARQKRARNPDSRVGIVKTTLWQTSSVSVAINTLLIGYFTIYCTDTLVLNVAIVGTIFMVRKLVDAVTDLLAGILIDRTQTRWRKGRPYEIFKRQAARGACRQRCRPAWRPSCSASSRTGQRSQAGRSAPECRGYRQGQRA